MGTLNPDAYSPMSGRFIGEDGNVQNVVDLLGASTPVSTATLNPDAYSPTSGRFIGEDGETHNIVDMLGGSNAVSAERLNINAYSPMSGRFIGEDGKVYNLVDMIRDNQSSLTEAINVLNGTKGTYTPSEMDDAIINAIPTETASGEMIAIDDAANYPAESVITTLEPVQEGSGDPSPDNIRPISGHTGVELTRTGKNLFDIDDLWNNGIVTNNVKSITLSSLPEGTYTISTDVIDNTDTSVASVFAMKNDSTPSSIRNGVFVGRSRSITLSSGDTLKIAIRVANTGSDAYLVWDKTTFAPYYIQLELGATTTAYEPYQGETHTITFPQEQSPVYGGEVDWVNGVLRVTNGIYSATGQENIIKAQSNDGFYFSCPIKARGETVSASSHLQVASDINAYRTTKWSTFVGENNNTFVFMNLDINLYPNVQSVQNFLSQQVQNGTPVQWYMVLATPIEIPLTPEVITLLKGENNIWTDSGTSEIGYKVDLQTYINKLINAQNNVSANLLGANRETESLLNTEGVDNIINDNTTEEEEVRVSE